MMTLKLFEFLTYICSGMICLTLGVVLTGVRNDFAPSAKGFRKVKFFVGIASYLDVLVDVLVVILWYREADYMLVNSFFCPLIFFFQIYMAVASLLELFRSPKINRVARLHFEIPIVILAVVHYSVFICLHTFSGVSYGDFIHSSFGNVSTVLLYALILIEIVLLSVWLVRSVHRYNDILAEYYSGIDVIRGRKLTSVLYAYFLYVILAGLNMLSVSALTSAIMIWITTILFVVFAISLINLQRLFSLVSPAFVYQDVNPEGAVPGADVTNPFPDAGGVAVDEAVKEWCGRPERPFLREGVTLADAADEMGVSIRVLSDFLNNVHKVNFNAWINALRVDEAIRIMKESPDATLSDIAAKTGFPDSSSLSRTFKRIMGTTVSQFRSGIS